MRKITLLLAFLSLLVKANAQNNIKTIFWNVPEVEAVYKESIIKINGYPVYKKYDGPAFISGYVLKDPYTKSLSLMKYDDPMSDEKSDKISESLLAFIRNFKNNNKEAGTGINKSTFGISSIDINFAGILIAGVDMSDFLKGVKGKPGIYVCTEIIEDDPSEIRKALITLERNLKDEIANLPLAVQQQLKLSRDFNQATGLLKYDVEFVSLNGLSRNIPKADLIPKAALVIKQLFSTFNTEVLSFYETDSKKVLAAATKFISQYQFPAAYAIKARYLLANNDFSVVKEEVINLLTINRKLLGINSITQIEIPDDRYSNNSSEKLFYNGIEMDADIKNSNRVLNDVFYQMAVLKYCDAATASGETTLNGKRLVDIRSKCFMEYGSFNTLCKINSFSSNSNSVEYNPDKEYEEFNFIHQLMFSYGTDLLLNLYRGKSTLFNKNFLLSGYRYLINKGYDVAENYNFIGRLFNSGFKSRACNADSATYYYKKSADAGNTYAMQNLAVQYFFGSGSLPRDFAKALSWLQKAKDKGVNVSGWEELMNTKVEASYSNQSAAGDKITISLCNSNGEILKSPIKLRAYTSNERNVGDTLFYKVIYEMKSTGVADIYPNLSRGTNSNKIEGVYSIEQNSQSSKLCYMSLHPLSRTELFFTNLNFYMQRRDDKKILVSVNVPFMVKWEN